MRVATESLNKHPCYMIWTLTSHNLLNYCLICFDSSMIGTSASPLYYPMMSASYRNHIFPCHSHCLSNTDETPLTLSVENTTNFSSTCAAINFGKTEFNIVTVLSILVAAVPCNVPYQNSKSNYLWNYGSKHYFRNGICSLCHWICRQT